MSTREMFTPGFCVLRANPPSEHTGPMSAPAVDLDLSISEDDQDAILDIIVGSEIVGSDEAPLISLHLRGSGRLFLTLSGRGDGGQASIEIEITKEGFRIEKMPV